MFKNKTLLITGGTGSFGNAVLNRFLDTNIKEIRIFSRDEKKQDDMRHRLNNPKVKFYIGDLAQALIELYKSESKIRVIGTRHGEKLYETLVNREEMAKAFDMGNYYRVPADNRDLNYDSYFTKGEEKVSVIEDYHSHNTHRLDVEGTKGLLMKLPMIRRDILGEESMQYPD